MLQSSVRCCQLALRREDILLADRIEHVSELIYRIFENKMEYELEQSSGHLRLIEKLTRSVVRIQTKDLLVNQTFWNYYHNRPNDKTP